MRETIRVSELSLWLKCRRRTYLQYEMGYDKDEPIMGVGRAMHTLLESYYTDNHPVVQDEGLNAEDLQMVADMMSTYSVEAEEEGLDVGQVTITGEQRYHMDIGGLTLTGQVDALVYDDVLGGIIVRDHKTVGQFMNTSPRDFQLMCYAVMARAEGRDVKAIEHNQIKRNKRTGRAKPPFIRRVTHTVTSEALDAFEGMLAYLVLEYKEVMGSLSVLDDGVESPHLWVKGTNECSWSCPFFEMCGMIDDGADYSDVLDTEYYRREAPVDIT